MESFYLISSTACFLGIVIAIFSKLYPSEKFEKQMKTIFSLVFLISVLTPILNGSLTFPDIRETVAASNSYYQEISENTDIYFIKSVENNISTRLKAELNLHNIFPVEVMTIVNISDDNSISISEVNVTISETTDVKKIKSCIADAVGNMAIINVNVKDDQYEYQ